MLAHEQVAECKKKSRMRTLLRTVYTMGQFNGVNLSFEFIQLVQFPKQSQLFPAKREVGSLCAYSI